MSKEELLLPLGGSGEIGGNMNLYAYGKENDQKWIIVDMGVSLPMTTQCQALTLYYQMQDLLSKKR